MNSTKEKKSKLSRFQTFEDAREEQNLQAYQRGFDPERAKKFLEQAQLPKPFKRKPALYRFRTFEELHRFDEAQLNQSGIL